MLKLLSKLKDGCHKEGIDLMHSEINGNAIKLACCVNGSRATELNAYIIPDGDSYNFYTFSPQGVKSDEVKLKENEIIPTLVATVNPSKDSSKTELSKDESENDLVDIVTIEVEDGVFDDKEVKHGVYKNSRRAYSDKYHKMGTIVGIRVIDK